MELYLEAGHEIVYTDGNVIAVRQNNRVEVWAEDGEAYYGELRETADAGDVMEAMKFYASGHKQGRSEGYVDGKLHTQRSIKTALGIIGA